MRPAVETRVFINEEKGLLYKVLFIQGMKMETMMGKSVKLEDVEMNCLVADGVYYKRIGTYQGLTEVEEI